MHFCADELVQLIALISGSSYGAKRLHLWWKSKTGHKCHEHAKTDSLDSDRSEVSHHEAT